MHVTAPMMKAPEVQARLLALRVWAEISRVEED